MNYIYNKPQPDLVPGDGLAVTGDLGAYTAGADYESRLNIANSSGLVIVQVIESTLPAGANVYVDQDNKQVVVSWPGSSTGEEGTVHAADLPQDGKFIAGLDGWNADQGWTYDAGATLHASFAGEQGVRLIKSGTYPCDPGQTITATLDVQQGASASYHVSAEVAMYFLDSGFKLIQQAGGNGIVNSSPEIQQSKVTGTAPAGTVYVQFVIGGNRYSEDKPLWVGNAAWDHEYTIHAGTHCLTIQVKDSTGSTAGWSGCAEYAQTPLSLIKVGTPSSTGQEACSIAYSPDLDMWAFVDTAADKNFYISSNDGETWTTIAGFPNTKSDIISSGCSVYWDQISKNFYFASNYDRSGAAHAGRQVVSYNGVSYETVADFDTGDFILYGGDWDGSRTIYRSNSYWRESDNATYDQRLTYPAHGGIPTRLGEEPFLASGACPAVGSIVFNVFNGSTIDYTTVNDSSITQTTNFQSVSYNPDSRMAVIVVPSAVGSKNLHSYTWKEVMYSEGSMPALNIAGAWTATSELAYCYASKYVPWCKAHVVFTLYATFDTPGFSYSQDDGATWTTVETPGINTSLPHVLGMAIKESNNTLLVGPGNGSVYKLTSGVV